MFSGFISARFQLGFATVALVSLGHASSVLDTQPVGQVPPSSWLETLVLDGGPQEGVIGVAGDQDYFRIDVTRPIWAAIYTSGPVDTAGQLYDPDGREIADDDDGGDGSNFRIETILSRRGTYYLLVESSGYAGSSGTGSYTLQAEQLDSPSPLSLGGPPLESAISTYGEVDYFRVEVPGPIRAAIYTSGDFDGRGTLLDPDGREIAEDGDGGEGDNFRIEAFLPRRGTYYLRVEEDFFAAPGSYTLHAERLESPNPLSLGGPPLQGAILTDGEVDYFRLEVTEPTWAAIYTSGDFDGRGTLLDSDGREIAEDDDGGEGSNFRIGAFLPRRGTYYLRVEQSSFLFFLADPGSYMLHAERLEAPSRLSLGGPPQEGAISTDETDLFRMTVSGPTLVSIYTSGGSDTRGTLLSPDGREMGDDDDGGEGLNFRIDAVLPRGGTYYLSIEGAGFFSSTGSYTLHAERLESPRTLSLNGPPLQGAISTGEEADYFQLAVAEPMAVVMHTSGGVDTGGEVYGPDGELIIWDDDGGEGLNFRIDTVLLRRGTYLLRIVSSHPDSTGSYTLHAAGIGGGRPTTGGSGGSNGPPAAEFELAPDNVDPSGIAFGSGRLHVVDSSDDKVYVYDVSGQRVPAAEFGLDEPFPFAWGIAFANSRLHVVDGVGDEVLAYDASGQRATAAEFDLDPNNADPRGIAFGNGRFHVVDDSAGKVYVYDASGKRVIAADFLLDPACDNPYGITFANGRLYVVDWSDNKVYAHQASGERVPAADFDLKRNNGFPTGITFGSGRFYVVDGSSEKVFTY